ncbi:A/G-specific adenine glycosylase [Scytonema sp. NUACC26]|uniref:A/G-specific adenine glycosylase n=1 Tax=Scytonema sp. NUACC26 TaxID=3140176 RepID=UPI0034DC9F36
MKSTIIQTEEKIAASLAPEKMNWFRQQMVSWGNQNRRDFPWRKTSDPYAILVAEFLLQKTDAETVVPIYETFLSRYPTLKSLTTAKIEDIGILLNPLGLFFRAERLHQSACIICDRDRGKIPNTEKQLLELPGIGKYTARAICSQAFSQPLAVLDTNVARILERFFGLQGERVKSRCKILWQAAEKVAPGIEVGNWNLTLLDFGALVCTAKNPRCTECPLSQKCRFFTKVWE